MPANEAKIRSNGIQETSRGGFQWTKFPGSVHTGGSGGVGEANNVGNVLFA